ncbi:MAG: hydrogenase expression/formation protein [Hyphomicrobiaceae bacterium]|nr:hydrogenase expression/formation protein [Hyphomicrobiaceae bacterium]
MHDRATSGEFLTGLVDSLIREIARHLDRLAATGETAVIDLRSLPLTPADRDQLAERLGRGEVEILFDIAGSSEAWETAYSGVWWVRHYGAGDRVAAERIEIMPLPEMLEPSPADIGNAARRLAADLEELSDMEGLTDG